MSDEVNVDRLTTDVHVEGSTAAPVLTPPWEERWRLRQHLAQLKRNELRTQAGGYDD